MSRPLVAVADLHGHLSLFDRLLSRFDELLGDGYDLVTLGDYADNGPEVPELLDRLVELKASRPGRFFPILGNHDLALLRAVGREGGPPNQSWFERMRRNYWNIGLGTGQAYGADDAASLAGRMPKAHRDFLQALPWSLQTEDYAFVHAGLLPKPLLPQLEELGKQVLLPPFHLHPQLRDKSLATVSFAGWGKVVVSGHTKRPGLRVSGHRNTPHFADGWRICLSAEVDASGELFAVLLPERRLFSVREGDPVRELAPLR